MTNQVKKLSYKQLQQKLKSLRDKRLVDCKLNDTKENLQTILQDYLNQNTKKNKPDFNGLVLFEGNSPLDNKPIVIIATGFKTKSKNEKTGNMIQTWIIRSDTHPLEAVHTGEDFSICGDCVHRQHTSPSGKRTCYVNLSGVGAVYKSYLNGNYPIFSSDRHLQYFVNRFIRFGSYGDPVCIPYHLVNMIASVSNGHTGYTHQWKNKRFSCYKDFFQASCDNIIDFCDASDQGWSTFRVLRSNEAKENNEVACQGGVKTTCQQCLLCNGSEDKQLHITIPVHGKTARYY